jgi:putative membrane protein
MNRSLPALAAAGLAVILVAAAPVADPSAAVAPVGAAPAPVTLDDATIIAIFDAANTADIETGNLAARRGRSAEVREFGAMIARDHAAVRQMGRDLAAKLRVTPTPPADDAGKAAHVRAMRELEAAQGAAFDLAFLRHEVAFHQSVIDAINSTLLPAIQNAELRELVTKVAPAFEAHRLAAATMERKLAGARR